MRTRMFTLLATVAAVAACTDLPTSAKGGPDGLTPPMASHAPSSGDRVLLDTRAALQQATSMSEALAAFGINADSRANFAFASDMDGAGTNALRVDWTAGSCSNISPSLSTTLPSPAPRSLAVSWKQRLGRTATGGGLGEVGQFEVFRAECGSAGRFVLFADRAGSSNRVELKWGAPEPGTPTVRAKSTMSVATGNQGWSFSPQAYVGQTIEQTLYVKAESAAGAKDGVIRVWVNDRLLIDLTGVATGPEALSKIVFPWSSPAPVTSQSEYYWDVVAWEPAADLVSPGTPPPPGDSTPPAPSPAPVASVTVSPATASIDTGRTVQLSAQARDSAGNVLSGRSITWTSSSATVASVGSTGLVSGRSTGTATITATVEGRTGQAQVTVTAPPTTPPPTGTRSGWYVAPNGQSGNAGTSASPWNLQTALSGAGGKVQPGDTVWIRGGTYPNGGELTVSGNASASTVFSGYPGETAIIRNQFEGTGSYVVIRNLVFEGPINGATNQVYLHDCHHVVFTRNEIRNGDFHAGLSVDESHHMTITYNYIHDNGVDDRHDHGIYFKTTTGDGTVIANNLLMRNAARGLSLHDNSGSGVYDVVVAHNTIVGNGSTGILVNDGDRITLVNNIAVGNGHRTGHRQIRVLSGNGNRVWNNLTWDAASSSRAGIENTTSSVMSGNRIGDPMFLSATDWRLRAGSPAISMGLTGWTYGTDYAGRTRDSAPDAGGYEH